MTDPTGYSNESRDSTPGGYSQPGAYSQAGYPGTPATPGFNVLSIVALIGAFVVPLVGIICGHIALSQIKKTGEQGRGLALWGTILGYVFTIGYILLLVALIGGAVLLGSTDGFTGGGY